VDANIFYANVASTLVVPTLSTLAHMICLLGVCKLLIVWPVMFVIVGYCYITKLMMLPFVARSTFYFKVFSLQDKASSKVNVIEKWKTIVAELILENIPQVVLQILNNRVVGWGPFQYAALSANLCGICYHICIISYKVRTGMTFEEVEDLMDMWKDNVKQSIQDYFRKRRNQKVLTHSQYYV
jgi:hypothetical protein